MVANGQLQNNAYHVIVSHGLPPPPRIYAPGGKSSDTLFLRITHMDQRRSRRRMIASQRRLRIGFVIQTHVVSRPKPGSNLHKVDACSLDRSPQNALFYSRTDPVADVPVPARRYSSDNFHIQLVSLAVAISEYSSSTGRRRKNTQHLLPGFPPAPRQSPRQTNPMVSARRKSPCSHRRGRLSGCLRGPHLMLTYAAVITRCRPHRRRPR